MRFVCSYAQASALRRVCHDYVSTAITATRSSGNYQLFVNNNEHGPPLVSSLDSSVDALRL